jgi:hypothetical protein
MATVFSLINKEPDRVARPKVDPKLEMSLGGDCLQIPGWVAKYEARSFALFIFAGDEPGENATNLKPDIACPQL